MAAQVMKEGRIKAVFVGADRVAANGDTVNKVGTLTLAILARTYRIPFYVFCPTSTIDPTCDDGTMIVVENARKLIGQTVNTTVTSVLQTSAGRMIFAKPI